jgi:hypothetical protein
MRLVAWLFAHTRARTNKQRRNLHVDAIRQDAYVISELHSCDTFCHFYAQILGECYLWVFSVCFSPLKIPFHLSQKVTSDLFLAIYDINQGGFELEGTALHLYSCFLS